MILKSEGYDRSGNNEGEEFVKVDPEDFAENIKISKPNTRQFTKRYSPLARLELASKIKLVRLKKRWVS